VTRLLLLRHAQSAWNARGLWQGIADPPLSPCGVRQANLAGESLGGQGITALAASDLQRARATAEAIAPALGLRRPLTIDSGLREYDVGRWSGLTRGEIEAEWPGAVEAWRNGQLAATPGGETRIGFVARITAAVSRIAIAGPDERWLVIAHGGVISALERSLGTEPRRLGHLGGRWIGVGPDGLEAQEAVTFLDRDDAIEDEDEGDEGDEGTPVGRRSAG
jgi:broad specificity phosphatase PhoE